MRFKRVTFSVLSPLIGFHYGRNPVSGQRFLHVAPLPFVGLDFEFPPYVNDQARERGSEAVENKRLRGLVAAKSSVSTFDAVNIELGRLAADADTVRRERDALAAENERLRNLIGDLYWSRGESRSYLYKAIKRAYRAAWTRERLGREAEQPLQPTRPDEYQVLPADQIGVTRAFLHGCLYVMDRNMMVGEYTRLNLERTLVRQIKEKLGSTRSANPEGGSS